DKSTQWKGKNVHRSGLFFRKLGSVANILAIRKEWMVKATATASSHSTSFVSSRFCDSDLSSLKTNWTCTFPSSELECRSRNRYCHA
ncbi:hypothetical protein PENTCL1PPCAC_25595, partial [Pristionchus entomophagus]